jgi:hypothetical protein
LLNRDLIFLNILHRANLNLLLFEIQDHVLNVEKPPNKIIAADSALCQEEVLLDEIMECLMNLIFSPALCLE